MAPTRRQSIIWTNDDKFTDAYMMFSMIWAWTNGWVNNRAAADLKRHRAHYGIILTMWCYTYYQLYPIVSKYHIEANLLSLNLSVSSWKGSPPQSKKKNPSVMAYISFVYSLQWQSTFHIILITHDICPLVYQLITAVSPISDKYSILK